MKCISIPLLFVLLSVVTGCKRDIQIGGAVTSSAEYEHYEVRYDLDYPAVYYNLMSKENLAAPYSWISENYLDRGWRVNVGLIIHDGDEETGNLRQIIDGDFDAELQVLADAIAADGRPITMRPLYEGNGDWFPWGAYTAPNDPADYVLAWQHVADFFLGLPVYMDWNMNRKSAEDNLTADFEDLYPGDSYVHHASISNFNRCGSSDEHTIWYEFEEEFGPAYDEVLNIVPTAVPINVAETSTTSYCGGDKATWYTNLFDAVIADFPRITKLTFFFNELEPGEASNDVYVDWAPENDPQLQAFLDGSDRLRSQIVY